MTKYRFFTPTSACMLVVLVSAAAQAPTYKTYTNARFAYSISYPTSLGQHVIGHDRRFEIGQDSFCASIVAVANFRAGGPGRCGDERRQRPPVLRRREV